jgi:hypothetical protein
MFRIPSRESDLSGIKSGDGAGRPRIGLVVAGIGDPGQGQRLESFRSFGKVVRGLGAVDKPFVIASVALSGLNKPLAVVTCGAG